MTKEDILKELHEIFREISIIPPKPFEMFYNEHKDDAKYKANERKLGTKGEFALGKTVDSMHQNALSNFVQGKKVEKKRING